MFCMSCGYQVLAAARFCPSCGSAISTPEGSAAVHVGHKHASGDEVCSPPLLAGVKPATNCEFRQKLLDAYLSIASSQELSEWLKDIGQDSKGTTGVKVAKIRQHTKFLSMPPEEFPLQAMNNIQWLSSGDGLFLIAESLGMKCEGAKDVLLRRIYRQVGYEEGWLPRVVNGDCSFIKETILPFVHWYPILRNKNYERDYYDEFCDEMAEIFGKDKVHEQYVVAHGKPLKIDFHIGHPQETGVGIEFKMPTSQGDIHRAFGQLDDYLTRYGRNLVVVLFANFMSQTEIAMFLETLKTKGIDTVIKSKALSRS
jgi:hypothetical protein